MKPDMPAAEYVRQVERQPVQRVDDRIDAGDNGGDHPVDEADDAIDGVFDGTGDAVPDVRNRLPKGIECLSSFSADVIPCVYKILLEVTQPAGDVLPTCWPDRPEVPARCRTPRIWLRYWESGFQMLRKYHF